MDAAAMTSVCSKSFSSTPVSIREVVAFRHSFFRRDFVVLKKCTLYQFV